jgi:hypothetical protein
MKNLGSQAQLLLRFQKNPIDFFKAAWPDVYTWDKLEEVVNALVNNRRVVVPAGHGVGKTWLEARIALWFLFCFPPAKVITTAPTWPQVELLLWSEIKNAYRTAKINFGGRLLTTEIKINDDHFAVGFSTRGKASEREFGTPKFQGFHSENMLVLLDEAPGVEPEIWISSEGLIVADNNKILAMGNPTSPSGRFYEACKSPLWKKVTISSFDHPNVKTGEVKVSGAVTKEWIEERRLEWGEDSPLWKAKVLGEFPDEGEDTLIPLSWVESCVGLDLPSDGLKKLGADIARFGGDMTVLAQFHGAVLQPLEVASKRDTNWTIGKIKTENLRHSFDFIGVDDTGVGGGVTDGLFDIGVDVEPFNFGSSAIEDHRFENLKAEIYWNLREAFRDKEISIPDDKELINQLCTMRYTITRKGRIAIESKDDMKKRGLKSPDRADAVAIAYSVGFTKQEPRITVISTDEED